MSDKPLLEKILDGGDIRDHLRGHIKDEVIEVQIKGSDRNFLIQARLRRDPRSDFKKFPISFEMSIGSGSSIAKLALSDVNGVIKALDKVKQELKQALADAPAFLKDRADSGF